MGNVVISSSAKAARIVCMSLTKEMLNHFTPSEYAAAHAVVKVLVERGVIQ